MVELDINHNFIAGEGTLVDDGDWNDTHKISGGGTLRVPQLIEEKVVSAGSTSVTFSGLNGDVDGEYLLEYDILINGAGDYPVHLRFNSDDGANYSSNVLQYYASTGTITNFAYLRSGATGWNEISRVHSKIYIHPTTGIKRRIRGEFEIVPASTDNMAWNQVWGYWKNTADNITQIRLIPITATISGVARLYRMVDLVLD